jgi:ribonuclease HI
VTQPSLFAKSPETGLTEVWVYTDGGARGNPGPAAIGAVVLDASTDPPTRLAVVSRRIGVTTNNVAEYEAVIAGLEAAAQLGARVVRVRADSMLVVQQLKGTWKVKNPNLRELRERALRQIDRFAEVDVEHVPREHNADADALVNAALDATGP